MDIQAQEFARQKNWKKAVDSYNKFLRNNQNSVEQVVFSLLGRSQCLLELSNYGAAITDCKNVIQLSQDKNDQAIALARKRIIHCLFLLKRFIEAETVTKEWLLQIKSEENDEDKELKAILDGLLGCFNIAPSSKQKFANFMKLLDAKIYVTNNNFISSVKMEPRPASLVSCIYCNVSFVDKTDLRAHCQTEMHEMMIMSDEGHDWHRRPPPRGFKQDTYALCENWKETGGCRYGAQCVQAHGEEELAEWQERFRYREMKMQRAKEKELFGKSYTEELLEKWAQSPNSNSLMRDKIEDVDDCCSCASSVTVSSKNSLHDWTFLMKTRRPLKAVALLQDTHRNHFVISTILVKNCKIDLKNDQEWISPLAHHESYLPVEYRIKVVFTAGIFGTFRQSIVFDFSSEPVLVKHLCVDVVPDSDLEKINEIRKEITLSISERWTVHNSDIVPFYSTIVSSSINDGWEKKLKAIYPCPQADTFVLSHSTVTEKKFTRNNYRERMHELLFVEEMARYELIARYNLTTKLQIAHSYILSPNSMAASTAKYSNNGELFASISLGRELSEDTSEGRLILMHCNSVYLCPCDEVSRNGRRRIFEAIIEDKGKNTIYLRLSSDTVRELGLTPESDFQVQIQFQLNRVPYCEWHYTLDKTANFKMIFPETYLEPIIPWSPSRQWSRSLDTRLNIKQKEAVVAITTPLCVRLPPILVIGPFGTGKTFTLAQAIRELIKDPSNRILLCTHSNSAADLYIKDYLDKWVEEGDENAKPLRIYYQKRWVATVNQVVQKYCLIEMANGVRTFNIPTVEDIVRHRIVVVTLSTSVYLSAMGLPPGFFTHILLDEAAQAIECETVTPLALAHENTRIVLAGDHMQLGPDIFSPFAKERNLHISLLERLYDHYPTQFPCKILLCENYRAHESIIQFTSESFYDQKLVSSSKQPKHVKFYPLTFFTTRGEDIQDKNSTAFYNNSEVYEVVERVAELKRTWPEEWGQYNDQSIGVVTPYADQVFRIRSELRKRRIDNVCVERVLNVQGKQFRAIILSAVRTRKTCTNNVSGAQIDYGFLSNSKLLNTAITRAQSLVAVVGDPIALCSLGRCSKVWERFIQICNDNQSLYGITWTQLKIQLDGIELKKIYTLNPLAPEFVPRKYKQGQQQLEATVSVIPSSTLNIPVTTKDILPPPPGNIMPHHVNHVIPPGVSPFALPDCRFFPPLLYPHQPPRPFLFNLPPNIVSHPLSNGFTQPIRVVNPPPPPLVVTQRPVAAVPPPALPKTIQVTNIPLVMPQKPTSASSSSSSGTSDNKLIQFMNNVHFPEANVLNDCINLLPQNMSLADMLLQPPNLQERWYNYLKESTGEEAAEKFKYLLHTTNQKGSKVSDRNIFECATPQSCESPTFNWYDSPNSQINVNKPVYLKDDFHHNSEHFKHIEHHLHNGLSNIPSNHHIIHSHLHSNLENGYGSANSSSSSETELQRHINEEFANLSISNSSDVNDVYRAFTGKDNAIFGGNIPFTNGPSAPRFYKYFQ